ncbi:MAG: bifunctional hydroxymethylpyrimidine kinase/phosphomethylpyrimidine kinase [Eggerthellaceae bacterium]|nr:bifunctional hydroxymethylpyrimidine kinase/phosphomethylpyrimidine kinase [Eggerthellaceae bacterium]
MEAVLSIAGSDSSGGAGIQADVKTIASLGLFAETAITALTAQNTTGVYEVANVDPLFVESQIDRVFEDIRPAAVKVGMVSSPEIVSAIARALVRNGAENIVVDPVMVATSGSSLIVDEAVTALVRELFPLARVVTPNLPEAETLCGFRIASRLDAERAAKAIAGTCGARTAVLVKGGHGIGPSDSADDLLFLPRDRSACGGGEGESDVSESPAMRRFPDGRAVWLEGRRIHTENTHGTGCTLSSAIACGLARGYSVEQAVLAAKEYVAGALRSGLNLGRGSGPLNHMWNHSI